MPGHRDLKTSREGGTFLELAELTSYAKEAYGIEEDHKWASFPGFSVLADPASGKWVALLMRQWDTQTGTEIQRCDIKCGPREGTEKHLSFLLPPPQNERQQLDGCRLRRPDGPGGRLPPL